MIILKGHLNGNSVDIKAENMKEIRTKIILLVFKKELLTCKSKTDAVLNTSVILDISEPTIWKVIKNV